MTRIYLAPERAEARFPLGALYITAAADAVLVQADMAAALTRHRAGDWGDLAEADKTSNEDALKTGSRILSAYTDSKNTRFWIITEADRSVTTVLLPDDY